MIFDDQFCVDHGNVFLYYSSFQKNINRKNPCPARLLARTNPFIVIHPYQIDVREPT